MANLSKRRTKLYKENPYCPQCSCLMILPEDLPKKIQGTKRSVPGNVCTIEHIYPRNHPKRNGKYSDTIILCRKCNMLNNKIFQKRFNCTQTSIIYKSNREI